MFESAERRLNRQKDIAVYEKSGYWNERKLTRLPLKVLSPYTAAIYVLITLDSYSKDIRIYI